MDGSKIVLPDTREVCEAFGTIVYSNGKDAQPLGGRPYALVSALVALDATLGRAEAYEVDLAVRRLKLGNFTGKGAEAMHQD